MQQLEEEGWGYWSVYKQIDEFEADLENKFGIPNPRRVRLIDVNKEYTIAEAKALIQIFGSHLAVLHGFSGVIRGQTLGLKKSFEEGMRIAVSQIPGAGSVTSKRGTALAANEVLAQAKRLEISNEAIVEVIDGWVSAYTKAWETISRMISVDQAEIGLQLNRSL